MRSRQPTLVEIRQHPGRDFAAHGAPVRIQNGGSATIIIDLVAGTEKLDQSEAAQVSTCACQTALVKDHRGQRRARDRDNLVTVRHDLSKPSNSRWPTRQKQCGNVIREHAG
jgi:hypothetical protein